MVRHRTGGIYLIITVLVYVGLLLLVWAVTLLPAAVIPNWVARLIAIAVAAVVGTVGGYRLLESAVPFVFTFPEPHTTVLLVVAAVGSVSIWWSVLRSVERRAGTERSPTTKPA